MKITDLKSTILSVPFSKPTFWPYGRWEGMTVIVIEIQTTEGITGLGESVCFHNPAEAIKAFIDYTKPFLIGQDPFDTERIGKRIEGLGGWNFSRQFAGYALGGIDMALWDIIGKVCDQPVYKLLGGKIREKSECFKFIHHNQPEIMANEAKEAVGHGYRTIYCKYINIEHLEKAIQAIREAIGDEPKLWVDFNGTLSPGFAIEFLKKMEQFRIDIAEQPVLPSNLDGMAYVRNSVSAQILAHESSWTLYDTLNVIARGAADIIIIPVIHALIGQDKVWRGRDKVQARCLRDPQFGRRVHQDGHSRCFSHCRRFFTSHQAPGHAGIYADDVRRPPGNDIERFRQGPAAFMGQNLR